MGIAGYMLVSLLPSTSLCCWSMLSRRPWDSVADLKLAVPLLLYFLISFSKRSIALLAWASCCAMLDWALAWSFWGRDTGEELKKRSSVSWALSADVTVLRLWCCAKVLTCLVCVPLKCWIKLSLLGRVSLGLLPLSAKQRRQAGTAQVMNESVAVSPAVWPIDCIGGSSFGRRHDRGRMKICARGLSQRDSSNKRTSNARYLGFVDDWKYRWENNTGHPYNSNACADGRTLQDQIWTQLTIAKDESLTLTGGQIWSFMAMAHPVKLEDSRTPGLTMNRLLVSCLGRRGLKDS